MCSPTSPQMASSTHWPSWSQAPFWWGSPKSPTTIGPSTADDDVGQGDLLRRAGQHVAAADAPLRAHEPGALQGQQDLLEVGLGEAGALGDVAHRRRPARRRAARARPGPGGVVAPRRHLHRAASYEAPAGDGRRCARRRWATGEQPGLEVDGPGAARLRAAPASATSSPRCSSPSRAAAVAPGARRRGRPGRAARPRRPRLAPAPGPPAPGADARGDGRRPDPHGAADHHGDRAHVDHDRHDAGRARRRRLPDRRRRRGAQRPAVDDPPRRRPPDRPAAEGPAAAGLRRAPPAGRHPGRVRERPGSPAPTSTACASAAGGCRRRSSPRSASSPGPASRSCTPTTTASTRSPTSTASAPTSTPSWRPPTGSSPTCSTPCRPAPPSSSPPTTARSTWATTSRRSIPTVLAHVSFQSGEGRFRWLHARPGRARALLRRGRVGAHGDRAWVRTRDELIDEGWFGPRRQPPTPGPPRRRRPRRPRDGRVHRADRHRPVPPRRPPRLGHAGRARRAAARRPRV